ncbi:MAG TPA: hypothetical protein VF988_10780 [Verrucomicrobiae bacterium]
MKQSAKTFSILSCALILHLHGRAFAASTNEIHIRSLNDSLEFEAIDHREPVIGRGDAGTEGNRFGFEGETVLKLDGGYQMFVSEMVDNPWGVKDGQHWSKAHYVKYLPAAEKWCQRPPAKPEA